MSLADGRDLMERDGKYFCFPVAAARLVTQGSLVMMNTTTGCVESVSTPVGTGTWIAVGRAETVSDNRTGANGEQSVRIKRGIFALKTDSAVGRSSMGAAVYAIDEQTVSLSTATGRFKVGTIVDLATDNLAADATSSLVWVNVAGIFAL